LFRFQCTVDENKKYSENGKVLILVAHDKYSDDNDYKLEKDDTAINHNKDYLNASEDNAKTESLLITEKNPNYIMKR